MNIKHGRMTLADYINWIARMEQEYGQMYIKGGR